MKRVRVDLYTITFYSLLDSQTCHQHPRPSSLGAASSFSYSSFLHVLLHILAYFILFPFCDLWCEYSTKWKGKRCMIEVSKRYHKCIETSGGYCTLIIKNCAYSVRERNIDRFLSHGLHGAVVEKIVWIPRLILPRLVPCRLHGFIF